MSVAHAKIRFELERIGRENNGTITPTAVVETARDPANILHGQFEWDDAIAGEQWRLDQARTLIRGVEVRVLYETVEVPVHGWIPDPDRSSRDQGYVTTMEVRTDRERSERALDAELNRVSSAVHRARDIAIALQLQADIDSRIAQAAGLALPRRRRGAA